MFTTQTTPLRLSMAVLGLSLFPTLSTSAQVREIDLAPGMDSPDFAFHQDPATVAGGGGPLHYFGLAFTTGDFDGDGMQDLAMAGSSPDPGPPGYFASVYLYYGPLSPGGITVGVTPPDVTITASGPKSSLLGWELTAGDCNGDGIDDLFIGGINAPEVIGPPPPSMPFGGIVYGLASPIVPPPGPPGTPIDLTAVGTPLLLEAGAPALAFLGASLTTADMDGDSIDELYIGAPGLGSDGLVVRIDVAALPTPLVVCDPSLPPSPEIEYYPPFTPGTSVGGQLAAGDVDGDGDEELVVSSPGALSSAGLIHILDLTPAGVVSMFSITGDSPGDFFGYATTTGDLNGDHIDDVAIGAPGYDVLASPVAPARMDAGAVYVLYGPPGVGSYLIKGMKGDPDLVSNAPRPTLDSDDPGGLFGSAVACGDTNADGRDDLVVGAPFEDGTAGFYTGRMWLIEDVVPTFPSSFGSDDLGIDPDRASVVMIGGAGVPIAVGAGELWGDFLGWAVECVDLDGDGLAEMIGGAPNDPFLASSGHVFLEKGEQELTGPGNSHVLGMVPGIRFPGGAPVPGNTLFEIQVVGGVPSSPGWLLMGPAAPGAIPLGAATLHLIPALVFGFATDVDGNATLGLPIPPDPLIYGAEIDVQALFYEVPIFVASDCVTIEVF